MISAVGCSTRVNTTRTTSRRVSARLRGVDEVQGHRVQGDKKLSSLLNTIMDLAGDAVARATLRKGDLIPRVPIKSVGVWIRSARWRPELRQRLAQGFLLLRRHEALARRGVRFHAMRSTSSAAIFRHALDKDARVEQACSSARIRTSRRYH